MSKQPTIGILALQGAYELHAQALVRLSIPHCFVKTAAELRGVDALILPGGESTTMRWLLDAEEITDAFAEYIRARPVMGTCAGMILLAAHVVDETKVHGFGAIDIDVRRNAYGRQVHSHVARGQVDLVGGLHSFDMVFIRAPKITRIGDGVRVFGWRDNEPTLVVQDNVLAMSFHPELSGSDLIHRFFVEQMVRGCVEDVLQPCHSREGGNPGNHMPETGPLPSQG